MVDELMNNDLMGDLKRNFQTEAAIAIGEHYCCLITEENGSLIIDIVGPRKDYCVTIGDAGVSVEEK